VRGRSKLLVAGAVCVCALAGGTASASADTGEGAATAKIIQPLRIVKKTQTSILKRGLLLKLERQGIFRLRVSSSTFDGPDGALTKGRRVVVGSRGVRFVRLKLTRQGRREVSTCAARTIKVRSGKGRKPVRAGLGRTTTDCAPRPVDLSRAEECNFIGQQAGSRCLYPFPDDFHTVADPSRNTGRRINLQTASMPRNVINAPIAPADYNRRDGFSPGATILLRIPGLDNAAAMAATGAVPINHLGRYVEPDAPIVVIDAETGKRHPIWAEVDANAGSDANRAVEIHPATNFQSGHRYVVALRNLKTAAGASIAAPEGFRYYRDDLPSEAAPINAQRPRFEGIFETLRGAGIRRSDLYLAWDFTVASDEDTARQMLHMRDDAFAELGDTDLDDLTVAGDAPAFSVDTVDDFAPGPDGPGQDAEIARRVRGTFTVPCYLAPNCGPGGRFALDGDGLPTRNGDWSANFDCIIPRVAVDGGSPVPGRASTYGHGLFGEADEVFGSDIQQELAETHGFTFCATDEIGMSGADIPGTASAVLTDLSNFPRLADRLHQGLLNGLFLGRLMIHPDGLLSDPAFHVDGVSTGSAPVIDTSELYYEGSSQGGIFGGALTAIAPDFTRSVLNVPGMNYSVLLPRSIDYDPFASLLTISYPDELQRPLLLALIQMLWDRSEPNGYAHRMTDDPLPNTPAHKVLMNVAFGDHQVTNFQADVQARTIGASTHLPVLYPGRWPDVDVLWNVPAIPAYPFDGSAIVYGDIGPERANASPPPAMIGVSPPPLANMPNRAGEDPHGAPRGAPLALQLISDFLAPAGAITNVCGLDPCYAGGFTGPGP
jgi:hypothetical protein